MKTLAFEILIAAPVAEVWRTMLDRESYRRWTAPFAEGSYYEGSWTEGERMHFLAPSGEGMCSVVVEHRPHELIRIQHIGLVKDGIEDTSSAPVLAWAPAYETYRFAAVDGGTKVTIEQAVAPEHEEAMHDLWSRALAILKDLCETT